MAAVLERPESATAPPSEVADTIELEMLRARAVSEQQQSMSGDPVNSCTLSEEGGGIGSAKQPQASTDGTFASAVSSSQRSSQRSRSSLRSRSSPWQEVSSNGPSGSLQHRGMGSRGSHSTSSGAAGGGEPFIDHEEEEEEDRSCPLPDAKTLVM